MIYKTEMHWKIVYAVAEIQNPQQMSNILFSVNRYISAETPMAEMSYKTEIHVKFVYASAEIQNSNQMPNI